MERDGSHGKKREKDDDVEVAPPPSMASRSLQMMFNLVRASSTPSIETRISDEINRDYPDDVNDTTRNEGDSGRSEGGDGKSEAAITRSDHDEGSDLEGDEVVYDDDIDYFAEIPDEILLQVFMFLDRREVSQSVVMVSRRWQMVASEPSLFIEYSTRTGGLLDDDFLISLVNRYRSLKSLDLTNCGAISSRGLEALKTHAAPSLQSLLLGFSDKATPFGRTQQSQRSALPGFFQVCKRLKELDLSNNMEAIGSAEVISAISKNCAALETLKMKGMPDGSHMQNFAQNIFSGHLTSNLLLHTDGCCSKLQHLWLDGSRFSEASLLSMVNGMGQLRTLSVARLDHLTDVSLAYIAANCPNLTYLDISGTEVKSLARIGEECSALETLIMRGCFKLTDPENIHMVSLGCPRLRKLDAFDSTAVDDKTIGYLAQNCNELTSLHISYCRQVTNAGIAQLANHPKLEELNVASIRAMSDEGLLPVINTCPAFSVLRCRGTSVSYQVLGITHIEIDTGH